MSEAMTTSRVVALDSRKGMLDCVKTIATYTGCRAS